MKLAKAMLTVGGFSIIARFVGLAREMLMSYYIGAGIVMDILVFAIRIPSFFRRIFTEGALNASFVPMFSELFAKDRKAAKEFAEQILSFMIFFLTPLLLCSIIFMPQIAPWFFPKFTGETLDTAIHFMRFVMPYVLMITLTALVAGILNSLERFIAAASYAAVGNLVLVMSLALFPKEIIATGETFLYGVLISSFVQFLWVLWPCYKAGMPIKIEFAPMSPRVKNFFARMLPAAIASGVVQISLLVGMQIAGTLPTGSRSYLHYSDKMLELPLSVIGISISISLLPHIVKLFRSGNTQAAVEQQNRAIEMVLLLAIPATAVLFMLAASFINTFFNRGAFATNPEAAYKTSITLWAYASGLPAYLLVKIFGTVFFAKQDIKTPTIVTAFIILVDISLCLTLIRFIEHMGIALATSIVSWMNAAILGTILYQRGLFKPDRQLKIYITRVIAATIGLVAVVMGAKKFVFTNYLLNITELLITLGIAVALFTFIFKLTQKLTTGTITDTMVSKQNEGNHPTGEASFEKQKKIIGG